MTSISVAVTDRVKKGDEWVDGNTTWYRIAVFGQWGEALAETCKKGDLVLAHGKFAVYEYEKDGEKRSIPELREATVGIVAKPGMKPKPPQRDEPEDAPW